MLFRPISFLMLLRQATRKGLMQDGPVIEPGNFRTCSDPDFARMP